MNRFAACVCLAATALMLGACAAPSTTATDWNRPFKPIDKPPVFLHDMAIANPPHPQPAYANSADEPTRFEFHPRNVSFDDQNQNADNGNGGDQGGADQGGGGGGTVQNGIMYVDPNQ